MFTFCSFFLLIDRVLGQKSFSGSFDGSRGQEDDGEVVIASSQLSDLQLVPAGPTTTRTKDSQSMQSNSGDRRRSQDCNTSSRATSKESNSSKTLPVKASARGGAGAMPKTYSIRSTRTQDLRMRKVDGSYDNINR